MQTPDFFVLLLRPELLLLLSQSLCLWSYLTWSLLVRSFFTRSCFVESCFTRSFRTLLSGGRAPTQGVSLSFCYRMTRATLHANHLRIPRVRPQHPVQPHHQLTRDGHLRHPVVLLVAQALVRPPQLCVSFGCAHARLHQEKPHKTIALFGNRSQPASSPTGVFPRNQA